MWGLAKGPFPDPLWVWGRQGEAPSPGSISLGSLSPCRECLQSHHLEMAPCRDTWVPCRYCGE